MFKIKRQGAKHSEHTDNKEQNRLQMGDSWRQQFQSYNLPSVYLKQSNHFSSLTLPRNNRFTENFELFLSSVCRI